MIQTQILSYKVCKFSCNVQILFDIVDMRALGDHIVELSTMMDRELSWLKREAQ